MTDTATTETRASDPEQVLSDGVGAIVEILQGWSESSWGKDPPKIETCRKEIKKWSGKLAEILPKLAAAQSAREAAWLELFEANDDPQEKLREATDAGPYGDGLDDVLKTAAENSQKAEKKLERAETLVTWWQRELARVEGNRREYEFWREYRLTKDEAEQFAFRCGLESGGSGYSTAQLQRMEERIRRINRSLPPGYKPIPSINAQTIMYVPSSVPGQYLPVPRA